MEKTKMLALLGGLFFGIWPLLMNKSGLGGNVFSVFFAGIALVCVLPFTAGQWGQTVGVKWFFVIAAGMIGAAGLICFNTSLAKATKMELGTLFVLMILVQTAVPVAYQVIANGIPSITKIIGFALAIVAAFLLTRE